MIASRWPFYSAVILVALALHVNSAWSATVGEPWTGEPGVTETVAQIMKRQAAATASGAPPALKIKPLGRKSPPKITRAQPAARSEKSASVPVLAPRSPQVPGVNFEAITSESSPYIPPDTEGAVGLTQIMVCLNGRFRLFDRTGTPDSAFDVDPDVFFSSVRDKSSTSDPRVRFDRHAQRWFITMITVASVNRVVIAVSSGPTITDSTSFTFFQFQHDFNTVKVDPDYKAFADYDTLGIDVNALYIGVNIFNKGSTNFQGASAYVIRKSDLLARQLTVTPFRHIAAFPHAGIFTPQGVDNDDANATEGYFIGVDSVGTANLVMHRVSNPGGIPSISGPINIAIPETGGVNLGGVPALGSIAPIDDLDTRLFQASIRNGSLVTAHNYLVDASGNSSLIGDRDCSRFYEITNLTGTPTLRQSANLFDASGVTPRSYFIPSCAVTGQGHLVLGCSASGVSEHLDIAASGRLAGDPLNTLRPATLLFKSNASYNRQSVGTQRWGDYTATVVDPLDNMTVWTFQEYCPKTDEWGVRVSQLKAPPPATPFSCSPAFIEPNTAGQVVVLTGSVEGGAGFYDPDASFPNHINVVLNGVGISLDSFSVIDASHIRLTISTSNALAAALSINVINPDGQSANSPDSILCIKAAGAPVVTGLMLNAPPNVTVNQPFNFRVTAVDTCGNPVTGNAGSPYTGTIHFSSSIDPKASLPADYTFHAGDNGSVVFTNVSASQLGDCTLVVTDKANSKLTSSALVNVSSGPIVTVRPSATPNPAKTGDLVLFSVGATSTSTLIYAWNFGGDGTATGATPAHVFANPGSYSCSVLITDASGGMATSSVTVVVKPQPVLVSQPTAFPNPAAIGQSVQFNATASEPGGGVLAFAWDFGDGTSGVGTNPVHQYSSPNTFVVTVVISDAGNTSVQGSVTVIVKPTLAGIGNDSDADGFSDDLEKTLGSNPLDPNSTPVHGAFASSVSAPLVGDSLSTKLSFTRKGFDTISLTGLLDVPTNFKPEGVKVVVDIGGVTSLFTLDSNGKAKNGFSLKLQKDGQNVLAQSALFSTNIRGAFAPTLAQSGFINDNLTNSKLTLNVAVIFLGKVYNDQIAQTYTATKNKSGGSKVSVIPPNHIRPD